MLNISHLVFQQHVNILDLLVPRKNGPIKMSINKLVDSGQRVVNGVGQIVISTFEIITGAVGGHQKKII